MYCCHKLENSSIGPTCRLSYFCLPAGSIFGTSLASQSSHLHNAGKHYPYILRFFLFLRRASFVHFFCLWAFFCVQHEGSSCCRASTSGYPKHSIAQSNNPAHSGKPKDTKLLFSLRPFYQVCVWYVHAASGLFSGYFPGASSCWHLQVVSLHLKS